MPGVTRATRWNPLTVLVLTMTVAAGVAAVGLYIAAAGAGVASVRLEIVKSALQVLVVAVVGNLLTLLVQTVQKQRERQASQRELRVNVLRRAVSNYAGAKKIRRQLRVGVKVSSLFDVLNDVQLEFESMKREVMHAPVFEHAREISGALKSMEKYLNRLIKECEEAPRGIELQFPFTGGSSRHLADFTGPYRGSCFQTRFVHAFDVVLALMQAEILDTPPKIPAPKAQLRGESSCADSRGQSPPTRTS